MNSILSNLENLYKKADDTLTSVGNFSGNILLLLFRLNWGWQFFQTGQGKLVNHANVVDFFTSLGIPAPELNAWFVGGLECFGGLLLLMGLASRPVAFLLAGNMLVAYLSVEDFRQKLLNIFHDPAPFLTADPFFYLLTALLVFCFGPGIFSVDALIRKWRANKRINTF